MQRTTPPLFHGEPPRFEGSCTNKLRAHFPFESPVLDFLYVTFVLTRLLGLCLGSNPSPSPKPNPNPSTNTNTNPNPNTNTDPNPNPNPNSNSNSNPNPNPNPNPNQA